MDPPVGNLLSEKGQVDEALACYQKAIELDPKYEVAHDNLGDVIKEMGQLDEGLACYQKAIELDPKYAAARSHLAKAQRLAAAREKLPAFRNGSYAPPSNDERLILAECCRIQKLYRASTLLYSQSFAADPRLAENLEAARRYNAACYAALSAAGKGAEAAELDDQERVRLRKQALGWLRADLAASQAVQDRQPGRPRPGATTPTSLANGPPPRRRPRP